MTNEQTNAAAGVAPVSSAEEFRERTSLSREQASAAVNALLVTLGAVIPQEATGHQRMTAAVNILGMAMAEVIATVADTDDLREDLIVASTTFIRNNSTELSKHYTQLRTLAEFTNSTLTPKGESRAEDLAAAN